MTKTMDFLIRFAQAHENFRRPELEALAQQENVDIEILDYQPETPFCIIRLSLSPSSLNSPEATAKSFISRSILSKGIYELWGQGATYESLHADIRERSSSLWTTYKQTSFKFSMDAFCGKRSTAQQREIIDSFRYLDFQGKISMKNAETEFVVFEEWDELKEVDRDATRLGELTENGRVAIRQPRRLFFGRHIGGTRRHLAEKHDLKKRPYISTTSMDAELALVTANIALAAPGKFFLDPFVGTGGFMVAASELGALTIGADIDGRSFKGKGTGLDKGVGANFAKYGLEALFGDCFTSDLINTPLRIQKGGAGKEDRWLDGIISDPPYGVREGLKVLGTRQSKLSAAISAVNNEKETACEASTTVQQPYYIDGVLAHTLPGYVAPKKPYSFTRMLDDILDFAARTLVDGGRLAFWMPSANEQEEDLPLPEHPYLILTHVCTQIFNKWSRKLLVYDRIRGDISEKFEMNLNGTGIRKLDAASNADDLNPFRKMYFRGFQTE